MGFFDDWHEVMDVQEGCIKFMIDFLHKHCANELITLGNTIVKAPADVAFPRVTFAEAQELYYKRTGIDERQEPDLSPAAERELCRYASEEFGTDLIFITDWLTSKRPFYAFPKVENPVLSNTFDLLCGGAEITSGGQRCHTYDAMVAGIKSKGMDPSNFSDYLSIFKYGMPPHGGFGMGLERLTMTILGLKNIREASLFPSDPKRIAGNRIKAKFFFGSENIRNEIIRLLKHHEMVYQHVVHEPAATGEEAARTQGVAPEDGVKSLILRGKSSKKNYHVNIPSHLKLDMKAIAELVGEKCEFESPEIIKERFGLIVSGIPPFGGLLNLDTYFDEGVGKRERSVFSCGMASESIWMKSRDLLDLVQPKIGSFCKE